MTKKLISFFAVSIGYPLLILGKDPFSTKLIYNHKKNELAEQQLDFEKGKLNESKQLTSNKISEKIGFRVVGIISNYGECSILVENQNSYEWVEAGNTFEDWHFNSCEDSHAVFLVRDQLKKLSLGQASINVTRSTKLAK
ncbi:MAG: hypothetical protein VW701_07505 [Deltaproteobacteria bacterium]|jgi:hypothetical protein